MPWQKATFKDNTIWAEVDDHGALKQDKGLVAIRYKAFEGAKVYSARADRITLQDAPAQALPQGSAAPKSNHKTSASGKGFGKAGTRSTRQAAMALQEAQRTIENLPQGAVVCFTDGGCRGNPGPAGSGVVCILPEGRQVHAYNWLGKATNNIAELTAIKVALDILAQCDVPGSTPVALFTDSNYSVGIFTKNWKPKANQELIAAIKVALRSRPQLTINWIAGHVGLQGNEQADRLANRAIDERQSGMFEA